MKKLLLILLILSSFYAKGAIHQIQVWNGYYQFLPSNNITVQLGDTVQWVPLDPPTMTHTITSDNIPNGAIPFDQIWQLPADTFFQYIPQVVGLYQYVCTPHIPFGMIGEFTVVNGPQTYVPDDNFEAYLEANGMGNGIANDDSVLTSNINNVSNLDVSNQNISALTGIEVFYSLEYLHCFSNQLNSIDVTNNPNLIELWCDNNQLTSLDVSNNILLAGLNIANNLMSSIDVSQNVYLHWFPCENNFLTTIDVSNNTNLKTFVCHNNLLTSLDVSQNNLLEVFSFSENQINTIDVTNNPNLIELWCYDNQLTSLDLSNNTNLEVLVCWRNSLLSLDVSQNIVLRILDCSINELTTLDIRNGNNTNMEGFSCHTNPYLTCISVDNHFFSAANWTNKDPQHYFLDNCNSTSIEESIVNKEFVKMIDLLGRDVNPEKNKPFIEIYNDGTVEKRITIN